MAAHLPEGVLEVVSGDGAVGAALVAGDVDVVAHVGSSSAGRAIALACARSGAKALLENGGNDALIVDEGVDAEWAAAQAALGRFRQRRADLRFGRTDLLPCGGRRSLRRCVGRRGAGVAGSSRAARRSTSARTRTRPRDRGRSAPAPARWRAARYPDGPGAFYPPTVLLGCQPDMQIMQEETFGPVAPVRVVPDFEAALSEAANDSYGLAATVLTSDMAHAQAAWRALPVGTVKVNEVFGGAAGGAAQPRAPQRRRVRLRSRAARRDDDGEGRTHRAAVHLDKSLRRRGARRLSRVAGRRR